MQGNKILIVIILMVTIISWWANLEKGIVFRDSAANPEYTFVSPLMGIEDSDITSPDLSSPSDIEYEVGSTDNWINWTVGDKNPNFYVVYKNSVAITNSSWINGTISVNVDFQTRGEYNFTIMVWDENLNTAKDAVWVFVIDTTSPTYVNLMQTTNIPEFNESNTVSVTVNDLSGIDKILLYYRVNFGSWICVDCTTTSNYTFSSEELAYGQVYEWYFWFNDSAGNGDQTPITSFTVVDTYAPDIIFHNITNSEFIISHPSTSLPLNTSVQPIVNVPSIDSPSTIYSSFSQPDLFSILSFVIQILRPVTFLVFLSTLILIIFRSRKVH